MRAVEVMPAWAGPAREAARAAARAPDTAGTGVARERDTEALAEAPDEDLVSRAVAGDAAAFDRLVLRHQRGVYHACYRLVGRHEDAADLAQETFLRAYRGLGRFRGDASLSTWLYRIAVNVSRTHLAGRARQAEPLPDPDRTRDERAMPPDVSAAAAQRRDLLRRAVASLPPRQRESLVLRVYHDLSYEEVAAVLGRSVGTVKANVFFAVQKLRGLMTEGRE